MVHEAREVLEIAPEAIASLGTLVDRDRFPDPDRAGRVELVGALASVQQSQNHQSCSAWVQVVLQNSRLLQRGHKFGKSVGEPGLNL